MSPWSGDKVCWYPRIRLSNIFKKRFESMFEFVKSLSSRYFRLGHYDHIILYTRGNDSSGSFSQQSLVAMAHDRRPMDFFPHNTSDPRPPRRSAKIQMHAWQLKTLATPYHLSNFSTSHTAGESRFRPLRRRRATTCFFRLLTKKPCVRARRRLLG